jgi:hypothetical protein
MNNEIAPINQKDLRDLIDEQLDLEEEQDHLKAFDISDLDQIIHTASEDALTKKTVQTYRR